MVEKIWNGVLAVLVALGVGLGWFLGGMDGLLYVLIAFVCLDFVSGLMCAIVEKKLSSEIGFRGIFKKILIFAMVAVAHMADTHIIGTIGVVGDYSAVRTAAIFFYLANEGISLLENATRLGLPIPVKLKDILAQLHDKSKNDGGNDNDN